MASQQQINLNTELYRKFGTSVSSDVQNDLDNINSTVTNIQNDYLPLAGGTMTGDLHLYNNTLDALYSPSISADQLLIGGNFLGSAAFQDISAFDAAGSALFVQENSLPLSGGIMNQDAIIAFQNGSNLTQGTTDLGIGGNKGISLKCSVNYELNYQAGRLTNFQQDGVTVYYLPLGSPLLFLPNTAIQDSNNQISIDPNARVLHNANGDVMFDWSGNTLTGIGIDSTVDTQVYSNSANWNDVVTIVTNNSAIQWNYQGTDIQVLTGDWQNTLNTVATNSSIWVLSGLSVETDPIFTSWAHNNSALFLATYNIVQSNSAINWNYQGTDIKSLTSNWQSNYTSFNIQSANNLSVYSNVHSNSANWSSVFNYVNGVSANNSSNYTTTNANSANWNSVYSDVNVNSAVQWNYQGTDIKSLTSNWQNSYTSYSVQSANNLSVYSNVNSNSANNSSNYTNSNTYSSNWQNVFVTVQTNSSLNWNYQGTDIKSISANWQNTFNGFSTQSANNLSVYSNVNSNSANYNSNYTTFNSQSANNLSVFSSVNTNSANWNSVFSNVNNNSASYINAVNTVQSNSAVQWNYQGTDIKTLTGNWQSTYNSFNTQSGNNSSVYSNVNSNSANYVDTRTTVQNNSAIWVLSGLSVETDPIFTTWARSNSSIFLATTNTVQANSANWNTSYSILTSLSSVSGVGGSTGFVNNTILRTSGSGGKTLKSSYCTIDDSGNLTVSGTQAFTTPMLCIGASNTGFASIASTRMDCIVNGAQAWTSSQGGWFTVELLGACLDQVNFSQYNFTGPQLAGTTLGSDTCLVQKNASTAQRFSVMNTYTNSTNFEDFEIDWKTVANTVRIGTNKGTVGGSARGIQLVTGGSTTINITSAGNTAFAGSITLSAVGSSFLIKEGTNAISGLVTLSGGTATINTTKVTNSSRIHLTIQGGTIANIGTPYISSRIAGTSFTITSTNILDASDVAWFIIEPA